MPEPIDEFAIEPDQAPAEPAVESAGATGAVPPASWASPPERPPSGWVMPTSDSGGGSQRRGCVIALLVVAVLVLALLLSLTFFGAQEMSRRAGTFVFGVGGIGCSVTGEATTFPSSASIRFAAYLEREVVDGETITVVLTDQDGRSETTDAVWEKGGQCFWDEFPPGLLEPGHYVLEYRSGTDVLAKGALDITP